MREEFKSLDKLSNSMSFIQTFIARLSGLLLMAGLVVATANLLNDDSVFRSLPWLQGLWGWSQAVAVDSGLAVIFVRLYTAIRDRNKTAVIAYAIVGTMLFLVAASITAIESVRQAFNTSLVSAAGLLHISLLILTPIRAIVAVALVAVSGIDIVARTEDKTPTNMAAAEAKPPTKKRRRRRSKQVVIQDKWNGYAAPPEDIDALTEVKEKVQA